MSLSRLLEGVEEKHIWSRCGEKITRTLWPISADAITAKVLRRTRQEKLGDPALDVRLRVLAMSLEQQANLHPLGRMLAWTHLSDLLETRLRLEALWSKSDAPFQKPVERPIFITGMPRSGSTFLHELLAQDPASRAPLVWEVMSPLPGSNRRRTWSAASCLWWFRRIAPKADAVCPLRATMPHECVAIHSYTMLSREFVATFKIPAYDTFLDMADFTSAYAWEKKFLQYLQSSQPNRRWILKAPDHVFNLDSLLRVFPDATIVQTHRDPNRVIESCIHLVNVLRQTFAYPENPADTATGETHGLAKAIESITRFREGHPELSNRFLDVHYDELVSDPIETVRRLYQQLNLDLSKQALERMKVLAASRSRYCGRRARPFRENRSVGSSAELQRFASYCERFGISRA